MKILVPIDGSKHSEAALGVAAQQAKATNGQICLINVVPSYEGIDLEISASAREKLSERLSKKSEEMMEKAHRILSEQGVPPACSKVIVATSIPNSIIEYAEEEKIDLIIMGSLGLTASSRFKLGSVSAMVVRHAPCSVYVVK